MKFSIRNYISFFSHPAHGSGFSAWIHTLSGNRFAIDPAFIPKVLLITATVLLATPFRWYERVKYRKAISGVKVNSPVFILGHPRSGTTFLHYLMSKDPAFAYCNTVQAMVPHLFLSASKLFAGLLSMVLPGKRPMDNLKMGPLLPKEEEFAMASMGAESLVAGYFFPRNFPENFKKHVVFDNADTKAEVNWKRSFDYLLRKLAFANPGKILLLKSPGNTGRIRQILEVFPDARFIHISRNPFNVYQSNIHLYRKLLPLLSFQHVKSEWVEEFVFDSYELLLRRYFKDKELIQSNRLVEIKHEDFIKEPLLNLEMIYRELELNNFKDAKQFIVDELKDYQDYQKNTFSLSDAERHKIVNKWKFAFEKLGYPIEFKS